MRPSRPSVWRDWGKPVQLYLPGFFDPDMLRIDRQLRNSSLFAAQFGGIQLGSQGTSKVVHRVFVPCEFAWHKLEISAERPRRHCV